MKKRIFRMLAALLALMLAIAPTALGEAQSVTDGLGREVRLETTPQTCVSLTPANTEILYALGLQDALLGVDTNSNYPAEALEKEIVGDYYGPNVESIVALNPDVVFAGIGLQDDAIAQLETLGIPVVCVEPTQYDQITEGIRIVAQTMGAQDAAEVLIADMQAKQEEIIANVPKRDAPVKVYCAISFGEYGNWTVGPNTFIDTMISLCGGENVAAKTGISWPEYSIEQLIADDPDVILVMDYTGSAAAEISALEGFKDLRCVQEGRVYGINSDTSSRPGPRIVEALAEFSVAINQ